MDFEGSKGEYQGYQRFRRVSGVSEVQISIKGIRGFERFRKFRRVSKGFERVMRGGGSFYAWQRMRGAVVERLPGGLPGGLSGDKFVGRICRTSLQDEFAGWHCRANLAVRICESEGCRNEGGNWGSVLSGRSWFKIMVNDLNNKKSVSQSMMACNWWFAEWIARQSRFEADCGGDTRPVDGVVGDL